MARQYVEVVLPDAASGQSPGTRHLAGQKAVTVQRGYGALFAVMVQFLLSITSVAVRFVLEPEISQGAGFKLRADERVRVQW
jgi:hypothetical protein